MASIFYMMRKSIGIQEVVFCWYEMTKFSILIINKSITFLSSGLQIVRICCFLLLFYFLDLWLDNMSDLRTLRHQHAPHEVPVGRSNSFGNPISLHLPHVRIGAAASHNFSNFLRLAEIGPVCGGEKVSTSPSSSLSSWLPISDYLSLLCVQVSAAPWMIMKRIVGCSRNSAHWRRTLYILLHISKYGPDSFMLLVCYKQMVLCGATMGWQQ